jgi:hypothetical protein
MGKLEKNIEILIPLFAWRAFSMFCYSTVIRQTFPLFSLQGMSKKFVVIDMSDQLRIKINPEVKTDY